MKRLAPAVGGIFPYASGKCARRWAVDYVCPVTGREHRKAGLEYEEDAIAVKDDVRWLKAQLYRNFIDRDHCRAALKKENWKSAKLARALRQDGYDLVGAASIGFFELVADFLKGYRSRSGSMDYYESRAKVWREFFGDVSVVSITPTRVEEFRNARMETVGPETVRKDLISLGTMFRWALPREIVQRNPADPAIVKRPSRNRPDPRPLPRDNAADLLAAAPVWLAPMLEFGMETGADCGEIIRLEWHRHVDREHKLIILAREKTGVPRTFPFKDNEPLRRILRKAWKVRHPSDRVFLLNGEPVTLEASRTATRRLYDRVLPDWPRPWKSLRATFCYRKLVEERRPAPVVAALMGIQLVTMENYVRAFAIDLEEAMATPSAKETK